MPLSGRIGMVTVTYNSSAVIEPFLQSVLAQSYSDLLLYAIDNASADDTLAKIARYSDERIRLIRNKTNVGFAEATNQGVAQALQADCESVVFINNDTEFEPSLIEKLHAALREYKCDMVAPKILYHHDRRIIWSAGGGFRPLRGYAGFHFGLDMPDRGQYDTARPVQHAPACCLLVNKGVFSTVGLMDPNYFVYLDDSDFCYRASQAGMKLMYVPSATLLHKASSLTGGPESDFSVRYRTRNQVYFMLKHFGVWRNMFFLPAFQIYQLMKLLSRKIGFREFALRQKAFLEGIRVWNGSRMRDDRSFFTGATQGTS
jgi:GT2 family glycosyltransferase